MRETSDGPRLRACLSIGPVQTGSYNVREISDWSSSEGLSVNKPYADRVIWSEGDV